MSRLLIVVRPPLLAGFQLAGVEAFPAPSASEAQRLIGRWLDEGQAGLLGVEEGLLAAFEPAFRRRLEAADQLPYIALPSGELAGPEVSTRGRIAELVRRTIGFHVTFRGESAEGR